MKYCVIILMLWKTVHCQKYCAVSADNSAGLFIYQADSGKDDTYVGKSSVYALSTTRFKFPVVNDWEEVNSLENNIVDSHVLDERWEGFMNNHDTSAIDFEKVLKKNASIYLSVRVHGNRNETTELSELQWNHLKSNTSGIYKCTNYTCGTRLKNSTILDFYHKFGQYVWKIHNYYYLYTNKTRQEVIYSNMDDCTSHSKISKCFFIYLAMCKECTITLKIVSTHNKTMSEYRTRGKEQWMRTNHCVQNFPNCYNISVLTHKEGDEDGFWAIGLPGYITEHRSENCAKYVRYIELPPSYNCEDSSNHKITARDSYFQNCSLDNRLSEDRPSQALLAIIFSNWWCLLVLFSILLVTIILVFIFVHHTKKDKNLQSDKEQLLKNTKPKSTISSIRRLDFPKYVTGECDSNFIKLKAQFSTIPSGYLNRHEDGKLKENVIKNRFPDLVPYNNNRVKLKKTIIGKCFQGDYINASYIQGASNYKEYIIAQSPQTNTLNDFWMMIWQERISYCVMITSENEEYLRYWPSLSEKCVTYAELQISLVDVHNYQFFQKNKLVVSRKNESREVDSNNYFMIGNIFSYYRYFFSIITLGKMMTSIPQEIKFSHL